MEKEKEGYAIRKEVLRAGLRQPEEERTQLPTIDQRGSRNLLRGQTVPIKLNLRMQRIS